MGTIFALLTLCEELHWSPVDSPHNEAIMQDFYVTFAVNWRINILVADDLKSHQYTSDTNRKYKDYVYRKMLVQEYLKK